MAEKTTLADASERVDYGLTTSAVYGGNGPRFLRITDIDGPHVDWVSVPRCAASPDEIERYRLLDGDIVVARTGASTGRSQWVQTVEPAVFASYLVRFRIDPRHDSRFVSYVLQADGWSDYVSGLAHGKSAQPNMSARDMGAFGFEAPSLVEQRAIAEVLGALDDKIAANTRLAQSHAELAQQLFESAASTAPLTCVSLRDLVSTQYGLTASSTSGDGPRLLRVTDINKKPWIEWEDAPGCTPSDAELAKYGTEPGDILVARMADPGKAAFIDAGDPVAVFASYLVRVKPRDPKMGLFIYYFLRSSAYRLYVESAMTGSVQRNMNAKAIVGTTISVPREDQLGQFNSRVGSLRASLQAVLVESRRLAATRDALLPALISGELRVSDAGRIVEGAA